MVWVPEEEGYRCGTCNCLFYLEIAEPEDIRFGGVVYCPRCGDDELVTE